MQMAVSVEVSVVISSRYIPLKLLWGILENDIIKVFLIHIFHQAFYKNFVILVFRNEYSPFVPIFLMTD